MTIKELTKHIKNKDTIYAIDYDKVIEINLSKNDHISDWELMPKIGIFRTYLVINIKNNLEKAFALEILFNNNEDAEKVLESITGEYHEKRF